LQVINYCHSKNIVHRDLKPENILFSTKGSDVIKVVDFGTYVHFDSDTKMRKLTGTYHYIAPEVLAYSYDEKCDLWSIGCILYIILVGAPPFPGDTEEEIIGKVKAGKIEKSKAYKWISLDAKSLIKGLICLDPKKRLSAE